MMVSCVCFTFLASEAFGLTVSIGVSPSTLNLGSSGTPITCSVWLPPGYDADDVESVTLEGISPYSTSSTGNTLTCKFDRATFEAMLAPYAPGEVTLTLTGTLVDGVSIEGTDTNVTASLSVTANFDAIEYVVVGTSGPNGSIDPEAATVNYGNDVAFTATPAIGYQVDEWSVDGTVVQTGGTSYTLGNVQADQTVSVTFGATTYVINSWADPGGSISPAGDTEVKPGDDLTLTAIPNAGYRIDRWFLDGNVVQIGKTTYKIRPKADHAIRVAFMRALSQSLGAFDFDDEGEFEESVSNNNTDQADEALVFVEPVGLGPDPDNIAMVLQNQKDSEGKPLNARAKGTFVKTGADEVLIRFRYLFLTSSVELVIYVSDWPQLLAHDDPLREQHYVEVARLGCPPYPRPALRC